MMEAFDWSQYLALVGGTRIPSELCLQVEESVKLLFPVPCLAELQWGEESYWAGVVHTVCGPLLEVSYLTAPGSSGVPRTWLDTSSRGLFAFGHCKRHRKLLQPPPSLTLNEADSDPDWYSYLEEAVVGLDVPLLKEEFSPGAGFCPADSIRPGMKFEWRDLNEPTLFWGVTVTENKGGLLGLAYASPQLKQTETDFYCFYTDVRLQPCGTVAARQDELQFDVPEKLRTCGYPDQVWRVVKQSFREIQPENVGPAWCFPSHKLRPSHHNFEEKMLLTIIDPTNSREFRVAIVDKTFDRHHFLVSLLEEPQVKVACQGDSEDIAPISWAIEQKFLNKASLQNMSCSPLSKIAGKNLFQAMSKPSSDFQDGQRFEFCENFGRREFCIGSIVECRGHILRVEILSRTGNQSILVSARSIAIFPVGWCEANGVDLFVSEDVKHLVDESDTDPPDSVSDSRLTDPALPKPLPDSAWCPPIYFNHLCYSASFLSRHRLETLPQSLGPGPVRLVMREVLSRLIGSSFKSGAVLKKLELGAEQTPRHDFWLENMKGKSRVLLLQADVEIPSKSSQVAAFCREVCQKLACCPYLFGPQRVGEECPSACNTRPKSDFQVNVETDSKKGRGFKRGRKRGKSSLGSAAQEVTEQPATPGPGTVSGQSSSTSSPSPSPSCSTTVTTNTTRDNSPEPDQPASKRRYGSKNWGEILPPSEMRTRGAKLPNFGLQLKVRPSKKDVEDMERIIAEKCREKSPPSRPPSPKLLRSKSAPQSIVNSCLSKEDLEEVTPKPKAGLVPAFSIDYSSPCLPYLEPPPVKEVKLGTNPLLWTASDVAEFVANQKDISFMSSMFKTDEVDGQAFLLLNLPTMLEHWRLRLRDAIMLARCVESVKLAFYKQFVFGGHVMRERGWRSHQ